MALLLVLVAGPAWALGDVRATVADRKLSLTGDESPNRFQVQVGVGPGAFVVVGLESTTVNGGASVTVSDVDSLSIDAGGGVDTVELYGLELEGTLAVSLGDGSDTFVMEGGRVRKKAQIKCGPQDDEVRIRQGTRFGGRFVLKGGKHRDLLFVTDASIGGDAEIRGGNGDDTLAVQYTTMDGGRNAIVGAGDGDDDVTLLGSRFDDVQSYLGDDDDDLHVEDCDFEGVMRAEGNDGFDVLDFDGGNEFDSDARLSGFEVVH